MYCRELKDYLIFNDKQRKRLNYGWCIGGSSRLVYLGGVSGYSAGWSFSREVLNGCMPKDTKEQLQISVFGGYSCFHLTLAVVSAPLAPVAPF